jgi:hypothetical protein
MAAETRVHEKCERRRPRRRAHQRAHCESYSFPGFAPHLVYTPGDLPNAQMIYRSINHHAPVAARRNRKSTVP